MTSTTTPVVHAFGLCTSRCDHAEPDPLQVEACRAWLRIWATPRKTLNTQRGSYTFKHCVERASSESYETRTYVSNGAFIVAAMLEGYRMQPIGDGPNAHFNLVIRKGAP